MDSGGELRRRAAGFGREFAATGFAGARVQFPAGRPAGHADGRPAAVDGGGFGEWRGAEELAKIFWEFGGERDSRRFARAIVHDREQNKFVTTRQLAELIERLSPRAGRKAHPATKIFQALRIAVNDEIGSLKRGLAAAVKILKPGGRLAVITFHSLEDRVVKEFGRERTRDYTFAGDGGCAGVAKTARAGVEVGFAQGHFAGRNGIAGKSAQSQRAIAGAGKDIVEQASSLLRTGKMPVPL